MLKKNQAFVLLIDARMQNQNTKAKLLILFEQCDDLSNSIDQLIYDIEAGKKKMKVYRQMKMYNDPSLNPILYNNSK